MGPKRKAALAVASAAATVQNKAPSTTRGRPRKQAEEADAHLAAQTADKVTDAPVTRTSGRPRKTPATKAAPASTVTPKPRSRAANKTNEASIVGAPTRGRPKTAATGSNAESRPAEASKKRGRPAKTATSKQEQVVDAAAEPKTKRRGRPAKVETEAEEDAPPPPKKRGRPATTSIKETEGTIEKPAAKKRGRPAAAIKVEQDKTSEKPAPKQRGRPAKTVVNEAPATAPPAKRGRPAKVIKEDKATEIVPKKRGRPAKAAVPEPGRKATAAKGRAKKTEDDIEESLTPPVASRGTVAKPTTAPTEEKADADVLGGADPAGPRYWLMKAEPDSRIETTASGKQVDVKFTIDDLAARGTEPWDGIRNHMAQKNLRSMNVGDLAFFSESSCKIPGLVGIMQVVGTARPDPSQFDPDSPYYDANASPDKPKWDMVLVELVQKFDSKLPNASLKQYAEGSGPLAHLQLFKQSRLSVSKVESDEWEFILSLVEKDVPTTTGQSSTPKTASRGRPRSSIAKTPGQKSSEKKHVTIATPKGDDSTAKRDAGSRSSGSTSAVGSALANRIATPARRGKPLLEDASSPAAVEHESGQQALSDEAESHKTTPAARGWRGKIATPASEPKPVTMMTPTSRKRAAPAVPATEPRKKTKLVTAANPPTPPAIAKRKRGRPSKVATDPMEDAVAPLPTPVGRGRKPKVSTPATEPKPTTAHTPTSRKRAAPSVPATEPRKRARISANTPSTTPAAKTPGKRGRPAKAADLAPVEALTPAAKTPGKRGRPSKAAEKPTVPDAETAPSTTPAAARGRKANVATPATEPKPATTKTPASKRGLAPPVPATEPRKRSTGTASAVPSGTTAAKRGRPSKAKKASPFSPTKLTSTKEVSAEATQMDGLETFRYSIQEPTELLSPDTMDRDGVGSSFPVLDVTGQSVEPDDLLADVGVVTSPAISHAALPFPSLTAKYRYADGDGEGDDGEDALFYGASSFVTEVDANDVFDRLATPEAQVHVHEGGVVNGEEVRPSKEQDVEHGSPERKSFLGRIGEGLYNVVASPGRAVSRALSRTPGPERRAEIAAVGEAQTWLEGLGVSEGKDAKMAGAPLPVTVEDVTDVDM